MVSRQEIQATCDDIVHEFAPLQVILFGTYAYGTPWEDSDVDLLVVMVIPKSEARCQDIEIRERIPTASVWKSNFLSKCQACGQKFRAFTWVLPASLILQCTELCAFVARSVRLRSPAPNLWW